jgi:hypothetical protein
VRLACISEALVELLEIDRAADLKLRLDGVIFEIGREKSHGGGDTGVGGAITSGMSRMAATSAPCSGPAPPKATSEKPRGSMPFWIVRERIAFAMLALMTVMIPSAASLRPKPSLAREAAHSSARRFCVELHAAAEEVLRVEPSEN